MEKGSALVSNGVLLSDIWFLSSGSIEVIIGSKSTVLTAPLVFGDSGFLNYFLLFNPKDVSSFCFPKFTSSFM